MLNHEEMEYFVTFANGKTLSEVAEQFCISQPTITRAMQKIETDFAVPLFDRTKNSIRLNDNGALAAEELLLLLKRTDEIIDKIRVHDRASRTISIGSAAAVQLPNLIRRLSEAHPLKPISTELKNPPELLAGLEKNLYQLIVLPFVPESSLYSSIKIGEEHLMFLLPKEHHFAKKESLSLEQMDGENILLFSEIGFWANIVKSKMPSSRFLVQNERYSFEELITSSILPCFTSDLAMSEGRNFAGRVTVPITNSEVNVTYYLVCKKENEKSFAEFFAKKI